MILGAVEYAHVLKNTGVPQWCRVRPLFKSEDYRWIPIENAIEEFPSQGLVYWFGSPTEASKDTYWVGDTHQNTGGGEGNRPDVYGLEEVERPYEFVELRGHSDQTDLRHLCATGNFSFSHLPIGPILVKIPGTDVEWVGPLELNFTQDSAGRYVGSHEGLSGFVPVHEINPELIQDLRVGGAQVSILRPKSTLGGTVRWFSAQDDKSLLQSALQRIRKVDRAAAEALEITKSVFEAYVDTLENAELLGDLALKESAREEALRRLIERVGSDFFARQEVAEALMSLETVQEQLNHAIDKKVNEYGDEIAARVKDKEADLVGEIVNVELKLESLRIESEVKAKEIADQKKLFDKQEGETNKLARDLSRRLQNAVSKVISHPVDELGKHAVVQALVNAGNQETGRYAPSISLSDSGKMLTKLSDLCGALIVGANSLSIQNSPLLTMTASLLSRRAPICFGNRARICSNFIGSLIAGDNVFDIIVPSNVYSINDLLNLPAVNLRGRGVARLCEVLKEAALVPDLVVLIFSGVNRAPLETAFENLIPEMHTANPEITIPFISSKSHHPPEIIYITQNVQLIGTMTEGPSTFRIPRSLRQRISIIDTECPVESKSDSDLPLPDGYRVSNDSWREWRESALAKPWPSGAINTQASAVISNSKNYQSEIQVFHEVYGESAPEQTFVDWAIARLSGVLDDSELRSLAESCGQTLALCVDEALQNGRTRRIAQCIQPKEI